MLTLLKCLKVIPYLRLDILYCLARNGKLSKSMVEDKLRGQIHITKTNNRVKHHRPEILQAFNYLESKGLIKKLNTDPGPGLTYKKGRPKTYFTITEDGLKVLLSYDRLSASRFWEIMDGFCRNNDNPMTQEKIYGLYGVVIDKYLKYPNRGISSQVDNFILMSSKWLEIISKSNDITCVQKVIEVLAISPKISLRDLLRKTGESESDVNLVLPNNSLIPKQFHGLPHNIKAEELNKKYDNTDKLSAENDITRSTRFILNNIITSKRNKDHNLTYELSLFGIMLSFVIIRYNYLNRLKAGLFFRDFSLHEYYDRIASCYKEKIPLIFGRWNQLKKNLGVFTAYNFDIVIDKEIYFNSATSLSESIGGSKELCEGIRGILLQNRKMMLEFAFAGWMVLRDYIQGIFFNNKEVLERPEFKRLFPLCDLYAQIMTLLHPTDDLFPFWDPINFKIRYTNIVLREMEDRFADEISVLYYTNLYDESSIRVNDMIGNDSSKQLKSSPVKSLLSILKNNKDNLLREWLSKWLRDLITFQEEILRNTKSKMALVTG